MKKLKNWDNKTWLSSKKYIDKFNKFVESKIILNAHSQILDIGCGRANIISSLQKKYNFKNKATGIDIVKNKNIKKNIDFKKEDGFKFLSKNIIKYDLILMKQTIHFFSKKKLNSLLEKVKENLNKGGKLLIFSLKTKNNKIPCFEKMKLKLKKSLLRDEMLFKIIKKNLKKTSSCYFNYNVKITQKEYIEMVKNRYISCILDFSEKDIEKGIIEIKSKYQKKIYFTDSLKCIIFTK